MDPKCAREKNGSGKRIRHVKVCAWVRDVISPANHLKKKSSLDAFVVTMSLLRSISRHSFLMAVRIIDCSEVLAASNIME